MQPADREARYRAAEERLWSSLEVAPTERRVDLPRIGTGVRVQELGTGPPVLFVHGASTCGTSWADLAARLPDLRCLLLDRPGTGSAIPSTRRSGVSLTSSRSRTRSSSTSSTAWASSRLTS